MIAKILHYYTPLHFFFSWKRHRKAYADNPVFFEATYSHYGFSKEVFCLLCISSFIFSISLVAKKQPPSVSECTAVQLSVQSGSRRGMNVKAAGTSPNSFLSRHCCEGVLAPPWRKSCRASSSLGVPDNLTAQHLLSFGLGHCNKRNEGKHPGWHPLCWWKTWWTPVCPQLLITSSAGSCQVWQAVG